jgi:hypothetical protein
MNYAVSRLIGIQNQLSEEFAERVDTKIYEIISGEFKLRKDGELDRRFKENKGKL